ncbi:MAG: hypothetical protein AAB472_00655 [Patescibacteria group bacterium]
MLGIGPDFFRDREELFEHGVGYNSSVQALTVSVASKGNELFTNLSVAVWCPSTAVELMRHPYDVSSYVGAQFIGTVSLAYTYRKEFPVPEKGTATWVSDLADRFLQDPRCVVPPEREAETKHMHAQARAYASELGEIPEPVFARLVQDIRNITQRFS